MEIDGQEERERTDEQKVSARILLGGVDRLLSEMKQLANSIREEVTHQALDPSPINKSVTASECSVRTAIRSRSRRLKFFPKGLFAEPAWDMLLDLYFSAIIQYRVSVSSLCIASNVPATTALRWIDMLHSEGLIMRSDDACDRRRHYLSLAPAGVIAMNNYFAIVAADVAD